MLFLVLELRESAAEVEELGAEVREAVCAFRGFVGDELDVDVFLVVVEGAGEGGQGCAELALECGGEGGGRGEGFEVGADGFGLAEGGVVEGALGGVSNWMKRRIGE